MSTPKPYFCRLEYLTSKGWSVGHAGIALLSPQRYVERLSAREKFGRATVLDPDTLEPTDEVYVSPNLPADLSVLIPDPPYRVPKKAGAGEKPKPCAHCDEVHDAPFDGSCLL